MKKTIIACKQGHYGKWRTLKLFVDGEHVTDINQGQTIEIEIVNNAKQIYGKMDWGKTKVLSLNELNDGDTIRLSPHFTMNPFRAGGILASIPIKLEIVKKN